MNGDDGGKGEKPDARPDAPPSSRFGRLARLGALAPRALPLAASAMKRAAFGAPSPENEADEHARVMAQAKSTAKAMLKTLGEMKGLPLKLGQMASYIDGLAPPGYEEKFKEVLAGLQSKAPPLSRDAAVKVVTRELGPPEEVFATWNPDPFAAASIGQVHKATTKEGDEVAVKVQYPDIDKAIANDLKSLSLLEAMVAPIGRRYQSKATLDEVKAVFLAELDYRLEADNTATFRKIHQDDEDIVIPRVYHALSSRRVLTTELIGGEDYATFAARASQEERNQASATIWRFMFRALFVHGVLYADPHPGNYRFLGGPRVAFLDYGCMKVLTPELVRGTKRYVTLAMDERWDEFGPACCEVLGFDPSDSEAVELYTEYTKMLIMPLITDGVVRHTHEAARESVAYLVRGGKRIMTPKAGGSVPKLPKAFKPPQDHTFMNRLQWGLASVMAGLGGEANWRKMAEAWIRGPHVPL